MSITGTQLLTPSEGAYYLASIGIRLSAETLRRLADAGKMEVHRTPTGRRLIPRSALDALAEARRAA